MDGEAGFAKVTVPGPVAALHLEDTTAPAGKPSSLTAPCSDADCGKVMVCPAPTLTIGGRFGKVTARLREVEIGP